MLKHWEEYCAGRFPRDPELQEAEQCFFDTLFVNPIDYSALNGLGNILLFEGELHAAEFFVKRAVQCAATDGVIYQEAIHDLEMIRRRTTPSQETAEPPGCVASRRRARVSCGIGHGEED
jgi:hypothetical protein